MADTTQVILTAGMQTLAVLVGILVNNSQLSDLKSHIGTRFDTVDQRFDALLQGHGRAVVASGRPLTSAQDFFQQFLLLFSDAYRSGGGATAV